MTADVRLPKTQIVESKIAGLSMKAAVLLAKNILVPLGVMAAA